MTKPIRTPRKKIDSTFFILSNGEYDAQEDDFSSAQATAKNLIENGKDNVVILKVVQAWNVFFPEEPEPDVVECDLDSVF